MKVILVVEDNTADVMLLKEAYKRINSSLIIHNVSNGDDAMHFLKRRNGFEKMPMPDLVLMDINMPGKNGLDALKEIKEDDEVKHVPVIIFSGSFLKEDVNKAYSSYANCYITKPHTLDEYISIMEMINKFWLKRN